MEIKNYKWLAELPSQVTLYTRKSRYVLERAQFSYYSKGLQISHSIHKKFEMNARSREILPTSKETRPN